MEELVEVVQAVPRPDAGGVQGIVRTEARRRTGAHGATFVLREGDRCFYADEDAIAPLWKGQRFPIATASAAGRCSTDSPSSPTSRGRAHPARGLPPDVRPQPRHGPDPPLPVGAIGIYWAEQHAADRTGGPRCCGRWPTARRWRWRTSRSTRSSSARGWRRCGDSRSRRSTATTRPTSTRSGSVHTQPPVLAERLGPCAAREMVAAIRIAAPLHDVGKVGVPDTHPAQARASLTRRRVRVDEESTR